MNYAAATTSKTSTQTHSISITKFISTAYAVSKQRRALAKLSNSQLHDIGMTPAQRTAECNRRFWQLG